MTDDKKEKTSEKAVKEEKAVEQAETQDNKVVGEKSPEKGKAQASDDKPVKEKTGKQASEEPSKKDAEKPSETKGEPSKKDAEKPSDKPSSEKPKDASSKPSTDSRGPPRYGNRQGGSGGRPQFGRGGPRRERDPIDEEARFNAWEPKTLIGKQVKAGKITNISEILRKSTPIMEKEIVEKLVINLDEEVLAVDRVQRTTDSGRRMRFRVVAAVGNRNGLIGIGVAKGKEAGPTIRKAIDRGKLNIKEVKRGCGSWECVCGNPHTVPFKVEGSCGSVKVQLKPAPRGVGLVSGILAKNIISLAGISDVFVGQMLVTCYPSLLLQQLLDVGFIDFAPRHVIVYIH
ncbi:30S ribosomal protein S5 [Candidatus Altiarchaeota archaeon]